MSSASPSTSVMPASVTPAFFIAAMAGDGDPGVCSPARAEACFLAVYEPAVHRARVIA
jgi:hypothetical protein